MKLWRWFKNDFINIEMRWSYVPPLMIYLAAGISGFTGIIESFFIKEQLNFSAAMLASLGFWAGLPWALKMPVGHMVDLFWKWKSIFVYIGASLMFSSLLIMVFLTGHTTQMTSIMPLETWYILSVMLAPIGFVFQDVVADAMTVEAVPNFNADGTPVHDSELQKMHITVQTLGRVAIIGGIALVAGIGGWLASTISYTMMYKISLVIPIISILGVIVNKFIKHYQTERVSTTPNWYILGGSGLFIALSVGLGLSDVVFQKEIIFCGSLSIIIFLIHQLIKELPYEKRCEIVTIATIIFIFRAMPTVGAGASWWQIDVLGFDEMFFGTLRQISAILAIIGMFALRSWMTRRPIPYLVVFLSMYAFIMLLPFIGMFYGLHEWTTFHLGFGAKTIAIIDTMADSPLGQVAMIPMLAWIAKEAPRNQKATYFAVMAAFANMALSASHLGTKYLNKIFIVDRGSYDELGMLMITSGLIALTLPILTVYGFKLWKNV